MTCECISCLSSAREAVNSGVIHGLTERVRELEADLKLLGDGWRAHWETLFASHARTIEAESLCSALMTAGLAECEALRDVIDDAWREVGEYDHDGRQSPLSDSICVIKDVASYARHDADDLRAKLDAMTKERDEARTIIEMANRDEARMVERVRELEGAVSAYLDARKQNFMERFALQDLEDVLRRVARRGT